MSKTLNRYAPNISPIDDGIKTCIFSRKKNTDENMTITISITIYFL